MDKNSKELDTSWLAWWLFFCGFVVRGRGTSVLMASEFKHCCHILSYSVSLCCFVYVERFSCGEETYFVIGKRNSRRRWDWADPAVGPCFLIVRNSLDNLYKSDLGFSVIFVETDTRQIRTLGNFFKGEWLWQKNHKYILIMPFST